MSITSTLHISISASLAHEINNPLTVIKGYVSTQRRYLRKNNISNIHLEQTLDKIDCMVDRVTKITSSLLVLTRQDLNAQLKETRASELWELILPLITERISSTGIDVEFVDQTANMPFNLDPQMMSQVILNLLTNAMDALHETSKPQLKILFSHHMGKVVMKVRDNGPGIPEEAQKQIFTPFFTTKGIGKGTGLGLFLCHCIIEKLNGELKLASRPGSTEFTITLPTNT